MSNTKVINVSDVIYQPIHSTTNFKRESQTGADPELEFWGASDSFYCLIYVRNFLIQLFFIENITV